MITTGYDATSPYRGTAFIDNKYLDILSYKSFPARADDIYKNIGATYQYRPDLLSYDLYKTVNYWWVFAARNMDVIRDPVWDFKADTKIYIPKISTIQEALR